MASKVVRETNLEGVNLKARGKVRDIYDLGDNLLIVASDRLSAFDVVLPDPIPDKGRILTAMSLWWFEQMADIIPNHLVATRVEDFPQALKPHSETLRGRSMLVKKCQPLPVEAIVRGYLAGTGWKDYQETGQVCGYQLPSGLKESDRLEEPLFTPSTKAELGEHDINIDMDQASRLLGPQVASEVARCSLAIYSRARELAASAGIIIADTKFEFGTLDGQVLLIDEILTPDSSRFWPADTYQPGQSQASYDKQYVRDYLESIGFNKQPPGPKLPSEVIEGTRQRYMEALTRLTGRGLD